MALEEFPITGQALVDEINKKVDSSNLTGIICWFSGIIAPTGFLICDGSLVSKVDYESLYNIIGDEFGDGTETEFRLPDLRAKFVRGAGSNSSMYIDKIYSATFGETQEATMVGRDQVVNGDFTHKIGTSPFTGTIGDDIGSAIRPYNIALTPIIKY